MAIQSSYNAITSIDGVNWSVPSLITGFGRSVVNRYTQGITYGNGLFVAVGQEGIVSISQEGVNWTAKEGNFFATGGTANGVGYGGGKFVVVGIASGAGVITTSPDGKQHYNTATHFIVPSIAPTNSGQLHYIKAS